MYLCDQIGRCAHNEGDHEHVPVLLVGSEEHGDAILAVPGLPHLHVQPVSMRLCTAMLFSTEPMSSIPRMAMTPSTVFMQDAPSMRVDHEGHAGIVQGGALHGLHRQAGWRLGAPKSGLIPVCPSCSARRTGSFSMLTSQDVS